ncbi:MAG: sigma-70 family RNA polymerase sigma factor [Planctomycetota bacterium]|nr:MAG: sigma-70 family RNA polymerase sigma factor [Planctomycetota bacterium]
MVRVLRYMEKKDDYQLILEISQGNKDSWGLLYEKNFKAVFFYLLHLCGHYEDACEICQNTFLTAFEKAKDFDMTKVDRGNEKQVVNWLYGIAYNLYRNYYRKKRIPSGLPSQEIAGEQRNSLPQAHLENQELLEQIYEILEKMPWKWRDVFILRNFENLAYQEISGLLKISMSDVKVSLFRARSMLQKELHKKMLKETRTDNSESKPKGNHP